MSATLRQSLDAARDTLRASGIFEWRVEAEVLLRHVVGTSRSAFLAQVYGADDRLNPSQADRLETLLRRRLSGEPLAYIVGRREFYGLDLEVNKHVLIPRPETELVVDLALEHVGRKRSTPTVVDVGTGSGAVILAIAAHVERADLWATDISSSALDVARGNAERLDLRSRVTFVQGDLLDPISGPVDVILSNPPYIPTRQIGTLQAEVQAEPVAALDGGNDGLVPYRRLLSQARGKLASGGVMIVELMPEQMDEAAGLARRAFPNARSVYVRKDLMGNSRVVVVELT